MTVPEVKSKLHFSLDLDSTLIYTIPEMESYQKLRLYSDPHSAHLRERIYTFQMVDVVDPDGTGVETQVWGVMRPYLLPFLDFLSVHHRVHISTASYFKYAHSILEVLYPSCQTLSRQYDLVLTRDDCVIVGNNIRKPLTKLYSLAPDANPTNTLALDDRSDTFADNPENGIQIPIYEPEPTLDGLLKEDIALAQLMCWLSLPEVQSSSDVRLLDKSTIFTTSLEKYFQQLPPRTRRYLRQFLEP